MCFVDSELLVLQTGCLQNALTKVGFCAPEAAYLAGPGLTEVCETVGMPPVLGLDSCVENRKILIAASEMVRVGAIEGQGLGKWGFSPDPHEMAKMMIDHIDKKRKALGIDRAWDRILVDIADSVTRLD